VLNLCVCVVWCCKVRSIKAIQEQFTVRITVEKGQRINRIRIQGPPNEVTSALDKIHYIFHDVTKQERDKVVGGQVDMLVVLCVVDCVAVFLFSVFITYFYK